MSIRSNIDVVTCRQKVRQVAVALNFSIVSQTMLVTAASELARNTLIHGGGGIFSWEVVSAGGRQGVKLCFDDEGPGIADIQRAMSNGWTSGKGMGLGLPGAQRLVNDFEIQSEMGRGTHIAATRWQ